MKKIKILSIFGTRPEAIKMAPVVKALEKDSDFESVVCVTAQHREMLDQILEHYNIKPDFDLDIMTRKQTIGAVTSKALLGIEDVIDVVKPNLVLVHGDTTTTLCGAMAAFYKKVKIGHVEAGLRTNNIYSPFPEEFNRQTVSLLASFHFAPTEAARNNLIREGKKNKIFVTGNTAIDALNMNVDKDFSHCLLDWANGKKIILLTAHRRENLGQPMRNMFRAINKIAQEREDIKIIYPIHKNPIVREPANEIFTNKDLIKIVEPLDVYNFQNLMAKSYLIVTDSGGIQEEAPSLGVPVLVMRDTTERPEGLKAGTLKLVGTDEGVIHDTILTLLNDKEEYNKMSKAVNPYGDGRASFRILNALKQEFKLFNMVE